MTLDGRIRWFTVWNEESWPGREPVDDAVDPSDALSIMIQRFLSLDPLNVAVLEELYNSEGESSRPLGIAPFVVHEQEVYQWLESGATTEMIADAWHAARGWGGGEFQGILTSLPNRLTICAGADLTRETIESLAKRTEAVVLQAFDGEGIIVWIPGAGPIPSWATPE